MMQLAARRTIAVVPVESILAVDNHRFATRTWTVPARSV
jgi:hypothetical protein